MVVLGFFFLQETLQSNLVFLQKEKEEFKPKGEKKSDGLLVGVSLSVRMPCPLPAYPPAFTGASRLSLSPCIFISFSVTTLLSLLPLPAPHLSSFHPALIQTPLSSWVH